MELFTAIDIGFRFNTLDFLIKFQNFGLLFDQTRFGFNNTDDKDSEADTYLKPCKTPKMKLFIKRAYYLNRLLFWQNSPS